MRRLKPGEYKTFEQLVSLKQKTLLKVMDRCLREKYAKVETTKDYIIAEGNIPIALVAHLDTVHRTPVENLYYDQVKNVMWSPEGLGADDRAGVYSILQIVKSGLRPHIILTTDEETGGLGAQALADKYSEAAPFTDLKYMIELDRRGINDCVFYDVANPKFTNHIESFGFVTDYGSFSDICTLSPVWKKCSVNLSVGYIDEHTLAEHLHVNAMLNTIDKVKRILQQKEIPDFEYIEQPAYYNYGNVYGYFPDEAPNWVKCDKCGSYHIDWEMFPIKGMDGKTKFFCNDCIDTNVEWCRNCGEAYEVDKLSYRDLCPDCRGVKSE